MTAQYATPHGASRPASVGCTQIDGYKGSPLRPGGRRSLTSGINVVWNQASCRLILTPYG